ncbi:MAG: PLDc_N domain-containing protein [Candidatus Omnitrophica bacterium]|nr:PLDc_N domain-containing protein [Candidatus Omnitrophota bacterium]
MTGILGLLILILDVIAVVDTLRSSMNTGEKTLWVILILLLPVIGMALYFLMGKKP